jgi:hypothetical protein
MEEKNLKLINKILYLGVTMESMGGWEKEKARIQVIGN